MIDLSQLEPNKLEKLSNFFFAQGYQGIATQLFYYEPSRDEKLEIELSGFSYEELDKLKDLLCKLDEFELASQVMDFVTNQFKQQLK